MFQDVSSTISDGKTLWKTNIFRMNTYGFHHFSSTVFFDRSMENSQNIACFQRLTAWQEACPKQPIFAMGFSMGHWGRVFL